jgi:hypothetical protein
VPAQSDGVQEFTGFASAAIAVTGGTVDLGSTADPGGNILDVSGEARVGAHRWLAAGGQPAQSDGVRPIRPLSGESADQWFAVGHVRIGHKNPPRPVTAATTATP